jgi:hypothetical protein
MAGKAAATTADSSTSATVLIHKDMRSLSFGWGIFLPKPLTLPNAEERFARRDVFHCAVDGCVVGTFSGQAVIGKITKRR